MSFYIMAVWSEERLKAEGERLDAIVNDFLDWKLSGRLVGGYGHLRALLDLTIKELVDRQLNMLFFDLYGVVRPDMDIRLHENLRESGAFAELVMYEEVDGERVPHSPSAWLRAGKDRYLRETAAAAEAVEKEG